MADASRNTFMRPDTFFGVCEAIGQDFGFNPLWLRLAFVPALFFMPVGSAVAYVSLGVLVLASRLAFPARYATVEVAPVMAEAAPVAAAPATPVAAHEEAPLALAA